MPLFGVFAVDLWTFIKEFLNGKLHCFSLIRSIYQHAVRLWQNTEQQKLGMQTFLTESNFPETTSKNEINKD